MNTYYYFSKANNTSSNPKPVRILHSEILEIGEEFNFSDYHYNQLSDSMKTDFKDNDMEFGDYLVVNVSTHRDESIDDSSNFRMIFLEK